MSLVNDRKLHQPADEPAPEVIHIHSEIHHSAGRQDPSGFGQDFFRRLGVIQNVIGNQQVKFAIAVRKFFPFCFDEFHIVLSGLLAVRAIGRLRLEQTVQRIRCDAAPAPEKGYDSDRTCSHFNDISIRQTKSVLFKLFFDVGSQKLQIIRFVNIGDILPPRSLVFLRLFPSGLTAGRGRFTHISGL